MIILESLTNAVLNGAYLCNLVLIYLQAADPAHYHTPSIPTKHEKRHRTELEKFWA